MKPPVRADLANDNGKPKDQLAAATAALHKAMQGLDAPADLLVDALGREPPATGRPLKLFATLAAIAGCVRSGRFP
jgi:hypothetical protein